HHLVPSDVIGPVWHAVPGSLRCVCLIGVDLGIDDRHRSSSSFLSTKSGARQRGGTGAMVGLMPVHGLSSARSSRNRALSTYPAWPLVVSHPAAHHPIFI